MEAQLAFERLVSRDFKEASLDDVKSLALAIWHESFVPDVSKLDAKSSRSANYLLDKLMRYNCVTREEKNNLREVIHILSQRFDLHADNGSEICPNTKLDKLAIRWGLESDLKQMLREMLPYQTRHYKHGQN